MARSRDPITVALVDDYDVVLIGLAHMFDAYQDRVAIVEIDTNEPVADPVDIVLYDSFAQPESDADEVSVLVDNPRARKVVVYTWNFHPDLVEAARRKGAHGYLSKTLPARDLVAALEAVHAGEIVISDHARRRAEHHRPGLARTPRRTHRSGIRDPGADHPGQEQRRRRNDQLPKPQHGQVLYPQPSTARSGSAAALKPCCGESTTASYPIIAASSVGEPDLDRPCGTAVVRRGVTFLLATDTG